MAERRAWVRALGLFGLVIQASCSQDGRSGVTKPVGPADASEDTGPEPPLAEDVISDPDALWRDRPLFLSGTRLRARLLDAGREAVVFQGFRDAELGVDCAYELAEDGVYRCIPSKRDSSVYFLDAQCTQAVWNGRPTAGQCQAPQHPFAVTWLEPDGACQEGHRTRVYRIGEARSSSAVFELGPDGCKQLAASSCTRSLELVPPSQLVAARPEIQAIDASVSIRWAAWADGARNAVGLIDAVRQVDCSVAPVVDADHCVPSSAAHLFLGGDDDPSTLYTDSSCSGGGVFRDLARAPCARAEIGVTWQRDACGGSQLTLHALQSELDVAYARTEVGCAAVPQLNGEHFFELGAALSLDVFPRVTHAQAGSGRLRASYLTSERGLSLQLEGQFFDTLLNRSCEPSRLGDGILRCVPSVQTARLDAEGPFADSTCGRPLVAVETIEDGCSQPVPKQAVRQLPEPGAAAEYYNLGARLEPADGTVYYLEDGACTPSPALDGEVYYEATDRLDLAVLRERVE
jgi:hypothetical protein